METPAVFHKHFGSGYGLNWDELEEIVLDARTMRLKRLRFTNGVEWGGGAFKEGNSYEMSKALGELTHSAADLMVLARILAQRHGEIEDFLALWGEADYVSGRDDHGHRLWALLVFARWLAMQP